MTKGEIMREVAKLKHSSDDAEVGGPPPHAKEKAKGNNGNGNGNGNGKAKGKDKSED